MHIRDRIKELRRVRGSELVPHPQNWRTHPVRQRDALRGVLAEVGYADALVARELPDGRLQLIDGHLRAETTPESLVPVLVLDVDEGEAQKLLLTLDPLSALAEVDGEQLAGLVEVCPLENPTLAAVVAELAAAGAEDVAPPLPEPEIPEIFQVVVDCRDEGEQQRVYALVCDAGFGCRVVSL